MMACYLCNSTEELSAKKMNRDETITFICRSCRRAAYQEAKIKRQPREPISKEWIALAKAKNGAIALKYRDNSFLEAKGLL